MMFRIIQEDTSGVVWKYLDGGRSVLTVTESVLEDNSILILLDGSLRSGVANDLKDELYTLTTLSRTVILDFEKVTYISSSVIDVLISNMNNIDSSAKGKQILRHVSKEIYDQIDALGTAELLLIEE